MRQGTYLVGVRGVKKTTLGKSAGEAVEDPALDSQQLPRGRVLTLPLRRSSSVLTSSSMSSSPTNA
jgi:hypothetical protein